MFRRVLTGGCAAAAVLVAAGVSHAKDGPASDVAAKIKDVLVAFYGKADFANDATARGEAIYKLQKVLGAEKDKKNTALKFPDFWAGCIQEGIYQNPKWVTAKSVPTKTVVEGKYEVTHAGNKVTGTYAYRGPNGYAAKRPAPLLLTFVDGKVDPKEHIAKNWGVDDKALPVLEEMRKEWVFACVPVTETFDVAKDPYSPINVLSPLIHTYNIDPDRIFIEGVGSACKMAQHVASVTFPERVAGLVLRNPQEATVTENAGLFPTVVVRGPEGAEKATAALAKIREMFGAEKGVEIATTDVASVEGVCGPLADWLKAAKPRATAESFQWTATFDRNGNCINPAAGNSIKIRAPVRREVPVKIKAVFKKPENVVEVQAENLSEFVVCMNDELLDLDREVMISVNGQELVKAKKYERSVEDMLTMATDWVEYSQLFPVQVYVSVPIATAAVGDKKDEKKDGDKKDEGAGGEKKDGDKK